MQEAEEQDTCRICSAPAEDGQPLFHPCKCSGTIRYIHQDCLTTWLAHSKKKNCDVCKHPYSFTKVYAPDMPSTLPPVLLIRRLVQQALFGLLFGLRAMGVAIIWLAILPWATVWTWRMYFSMGDSTAWWISGRPRPTPSETSPFYYNILPDPSIPLPKTFIGRLTAHPAWIALSADIFTGQIIASLIVLTFVAVFLLREWISQNARPGVFEDEEVLPQEQIPPQVQIQGQPLGPHPQVQQRGINALDEALARRQIEALRAIDALRARNEINHHIVGSARAHGRSPLERARKKGKTRQLIQGTHPFDPELLATARRALLPEGLEDEDGPETDHERSKRRSFSRRVFTARLAGARRKATLAATGRPPPLPAVPVPANPRFEFTFKPSSQSGASGQETLEQSGPSSDGTSRGVFPHVTLQPPRASIPFAFGQTTIASTSSLSIEDANDVNLTPSSSSSSLNYIKARRPPLPASIVSTVGPTPVASHAGTPMDSPSLATYRAPEELEAEGGPSQLRDYFEENNDESEEEEGEEEEEEEEEGQSSEEFIGTDIKSQVDKYFEQPHADEFDDVARLASMEGTDDEDEGEDEDERSEDEGYEPGEDDGHRDVLVESDGDDDEELEEGVGEEEVEDFLLGDGQWEAVEVEGAEGAEGGVRIPEAPVAAAQERGLENQPPVNGGFPPAVNEEVEGNVEDDMEGAMEAIGMRGPIYGVFQNAALMIFVLDTAIGLGVWIPFTIGKSTALLSLNPPRFLQILHFPIRTIRIVTDPIVDSLIFFVVGLLWPPFGRVLRHLAAFLIGGVLLLIQKIFGENIANRVVEFAIKVGSRISVLSNKPLEQFFSSGPKSQAHSSSLASAFAAKIGYIIDKSEPYFALIGMEVRLGYVKMQETWSRLALGEGPGERAFAIVLGYAVASVVLAIYLNLLTVGNAKSAGRAVRSAVRQQLLVLKVATFIFIELVTFPLSCGIVLDLCTIWLFPEANFASRAAFLVEAPLTATFYHWVAGTMFMYAFAVLLSGCRTVMRAGAMWFIKDPQDQNSHPIRDILDRPTLTQLKKICISGIMYSCVVVCVVSSVAGLLLLGSKSIMPFRWKNREPLSNVPIDLLFLHLILPYTMHYFRPKKALKEFVTMIWKALARRLRLTSYFFGGRYPSEEYSTRWRLFSRPSGENTDPTPDGSFSRVPAVDNIALPRDMAVRAKVTATGEPVDDEARALMNRQNAEIEKAKKHIKDQFTIVYIPPYFRYRVSCFIAILWVIGATLLGVAVALPIQLGRSFFELFTTRNVHDGYAMIVGFYLLWGSYLIVVSIDRMDRRRQRIAGDRNRADLPVLIIKRGLVWAVKATYMAICLGVIIPTLISFVVDLYIVLPIRLALDPGMTPRIRVVDTWALGLLYAKIALHATRIQHPNRVIQGLQHITANGWTNPDPIQATKEMIGPVTGGLIGMIVFPGAIFRSIQYFLPNITLDDKFIFMHLYPGIFMFAGLVRSALMLHGMLSSWSQSIRDKEFLVEMRLRNHEPEKGNGKMELDNIPSQVNEAVRGE